MTLVHGAGVTVSRRYSCGKIRRRRAGAGMALIASILLVFLLMLIGLAFLQTSRQDRHSSVQDTRNTQIQLLIDGAGHMTQAAITQGVWPPVAGRHSDDFQSDGFLAARVPVRLSEVALSWSALDRNANGSILRAYFQGDYVADGDRFWVCRKTHVASDALRPAAASVLWLDSGASSDGLAPVWLTTSQLFAGSFEDPSGASARTGRQMIFFPTFTTVGAQNLPALRFYHPGKDAMTTFPAADTDGDGIADALLIRLPAGPLGSIDYFAAIRVVDGNSAINTSVAWEPAPGGAAEQWFPTNINLRDLLKGSDVEINRLNRVRFGQASISQDQSALPPPAFYTLLATADDAGTLRKDFDFLSPYDALWMQLGRRLANPGYVSPVGPRFTAFAARDVGALAYKGGALINIVGGPTPMQSILFESTYASAANSHGNPMAGASRYPQVESSIAQWFETFDYTKETPDRATWRPRAALLTTRNPVAAVAPYRDMRPLMTAGEPPTVTTVGEPGKMPFTDGPAPRASINAAPFGELWRAFWNVMADDWSGARTPFSDYYNYRIAHDSPGTYDDPYLGMKFDPATFQPDTRQHPARMFRSPLRAIRAAGVTPGGPDRPFDANTPRLPPDQVLLLRAALAAVNTIELRANDDQISPQDIHLSALVSGVKVPVTARVYGSQRQPFISEVFASNDSISPDPTDAAATNANGYIAIVLYNPNSAPIDLVNCKLATVYRGNSPAAGVAGKTGYPSLTVLDLATQSPAVSLSAARSNSADAGTSPLAPTIVPPGGYLVLENYDARDLPDPQRDPRAADYRAVAAWAPDALQVVNSTGLVPPKLMAGTTINFAFVPNLDALFDREVVILRPLGAQYIAEAIDNVAYDGTDPARPMFLRYTDIASPSAAVDMAPLDSFDFTGLAAPVEDPTPSLWHYVRQTRPIAGDPSAVPWGFVYPGRYDAGASSPRHQGTLVSPTVPDLPANANSSNQLIIASPQATYPNTFSIYLHDAGGAQTNPVTGPTGNRFPFGGFARDGDMLAIPFIGSYRIQLDSQLGTSQVLELNAITMDSAFAEDTDPLHTASVTQASVPHEEVGRFAPTSVELSSSAVGLVQSTSLNALFDPVRIEPTDAWAGFELLITDGPAKGQIATVVSSDPATGALAVTPSWRAPPAVGNGYLLRHKNYSWAARLFESVGVLTPAPAALPQANAADYRYWDKTLGQWAPVQPPPVAIRTTPRTAPGDFGVTEGLININTASWKVLACVPFFAADGDALDFRLDDDNPLRQGLPRISSNGRLDNEEIAIAIINWRNSHGPFRDLFDLLQVPAFVRASQLVVRFDPAAAGLTDYQSQYYLLTRVSNLLTTRSDSFTCYVMLQGWSGVGSANPQMVLQRRDSFLVDRSRLAAPGHTIGVQRFFND